ncbi:Altered inheritance of mitochondria protein 18 mitochondrial [Lignoscripta atroalba]|nr:Altered inheritance of mitochondria protein 18 mitochondrial [Lignoscripta atroalba]
MTAQRLEADRRAYYTRRSYYAAAGAVFCALATLVLASTVEIEGNQVERNDAPSQTQTQRQRLERGNAVVGGVTGGAEIRKAGDGNNSSAAGRSPSPAAGEGKVELVETGTSTVPYFPRTLTLPSSSSSSSSPSSASPALPAGIGSAPNQEYHLLGLGIRTVSFLSIQVYVVGLYISTADISTLQARLVKKVAGTETASTLVADEKETLRAMLLGEKGTGSGSRSDEEIWDQVLREGGIKSVIRIVPTRNTDFGHLRDGWVRGITARSQQPGARQTRKEEEKDLTPNTTAAGQGQDRAVHDTYDDEAFGTAVSAFKQLFGGAGRKGVGKGKVLMLGRDGEGVLSAWVEGEATPEPSPSPSLEPSREHDRESERFVKLGEVRDERISRLVWLGYLAGKNVASEGARRSVVEGVLELVARPVGTVETMVV